jgi:hypothetical protein
MAQTGYTPILIYSSSTAAAAPVAGNLTNSTLGSELAINITDGKLFYKDNANAIQVIGWKTVPTSAGGTGLTSYTAGDLIYYASGTTFTKLAIGTAYQALQVNAGGTAPSWQPSASSVLTAQGDLLYASAANTLARLAKNTTATRYLANTGTTNNPQWDQVNLANGVTGTLPTTNGGTGLTSFTANGVVYASSTSALATGTSLVFDGTNLGIGTNSPGSILAVSAASPTITLTATTTTGTTIGNKNNRLLLTAASVTVNNGGEVVFGIADTNTGRWGAISGAIQTNSSGGATGDILFATKSSNAATSLTERVRITSGGGFTCAGIYNTTVGATNRDVFVDNGGVVGYVASIRASKTNIQDLTDTSWLHQLNPVSFNYRKKDDEGNYVDEIDGGIQYGMIAEDVEQVRPDLCFYDEIDGQHELRGIQYSKLVPVMLKEIQKLRAELNALKSYE